MKDKLAILLNTIDKKISELKAQEELVLVLLRRIEGNIKERIAILKTLKELHK